MDASLRTVFEKMLTCALSFIVIVHNVLWLVKLWSMTSVQTTDCLRCELKRWVSGLHENVVESIGYFTCVFLSGAVAEDFYVYGDIFCISWLQ